MQRRDVLRTLLYGGAGTVVLGPVVSCDSPSKSGEAEKTALTHEALQNFAENGWEFINQKGEKVNLSTVEKWLEKHNSTLSFLYAGCKDGKCDAIAKNLAILSNEHKSVRNLVVSVIPDSDFSPSGLQRILTDAGLTDKNTYVLYPVKEKKTQYEQLQAGNEIVPQIQQGLHLKTVDGDNKQHEPKVIFYGKDGKELADRYRLRDGTILDKYNQLIQQKTESRKL